MSNNSDFIGLDGKFTFHNKGSEPRDFGNLNFSHMIDAHERFTLQPIEAYLPQHLIFGRHVSFQQFAFGFQDSELRITVNLKDMMSQFVSHVHNNHYQLPRKTIDTFHWGLRNLITAEISSFTGHLGIIDAGLFVLRQLEETTAFVRSYREGLIDAEHELKKYY